MHAGHENQTSRRPGLPAEGAGAAVLRHRGPGQRSCYRQCQRQCHCLWRSCASGSRQPWQQPKRRLLEHLHAGQHTLYHPGIQEGAHVQAASDAREPENRVVELDARAMGTEPGPEALQHRQRHHEEQARRQRLPFGLQEIVRRSGFLRDTAPPYFLSLLFV